MTQAETMTITVPPEVAAVIRSAVEGGDYASTGDVVREALQDWELKRAVQV